MRLLFLVEAGEKAGLGHLMRCLALAQACAIKGYEITFVLPAAVLPVCRQRHDWVGNVVTLPVNLPQPQWPQWLTQHKLVDDNTIVVFDGYGLGSELRQDVGERCRASICFDDANLHIPLYCDLVINSSDAARREYYQQHAPSAQCCLGPDCRVLRQEFYQSVSKPLTQRNSLLIMMGGADTANLTLPLLKALQRYDVAFPVRVITGDAYPHLDALQQWLRTSSINIQHIHACQNVAECMSEARLAVSAAGGSQFELAACQTPSILVVVAENQLPATRCAENKGEAIMENGLVPVDMDRLAARVCTLWHDEQQLEAMYQQLAPYRQVKGEALLSALESL